DFQLIDGRFVRDDLYVFAVDLESGRFLAHGASPALVGTDAHALQDTNGRHVISLMINTLKSKESGELEYQWLNPISGKTELKHSYFRAVDGKLVAVGYYHR
ncbi:MAG: cache domain-containing protein, partial [Burkholderiaceae bacterium]